MFLFEESKFPMYGLYIMICVCVHVRLTFIGIFTGSCSGWMDCVEFISGLFVGAGNLHNGRVGMGLWWDCPSHCSRGRVQFVSRICEK